MIFTVGPEAAGWRCKEMVRGSRKRIWEEKEMIDNFWLETYLLKNSELTKMKYFRITFQLFQNVLIFH